MPLRKMNFWLLKHHNDCTSRSQKITFMECYMHYMGICTMEI